MPYWLTRDPRAQALIGTSLVAAFPSEWASPSNVSPRSSLPISRHPNEPIDVTERDWRHVHAAPSCLGMVLERSCLRRTIMPKATPGRVRSGRLLTLDR
jgi:hypothetical protein